MRLINARTYALEEFLESSTPRYAILSHTWETAEVSFKCMQDLDQAQQKAGFIKIRYTCQQARKDRLEYVWVDTCCIDKSSSAELQEAINSMYRWYAEAERCYVYLSDIMGSCCRLEDTVISVINTIRISDEDRAEELDFWHGKFANCRWFTRGWTLQELIAPKDVTFYGRLWKFIGRKQDLVRTISVATQIDESILSGDKPVSSISVAKRMSWAANRITSRTEDRAYSLLGIFNVNMPMLYGEGSKAFVRLQEEIIRSSSDHSLFAWGCIDKLANDRLFARSPSDFVYADKIVQWGMPDSFQMTNRGLRIYLPVTERIVGHRTEHLAVLNCHYEHDLFGTLAIRLSKYTDREEYYVLSGEEDGNTGLGQDSDTPKSSRLAFMSTQGMQQLEKRPLIITQSYEPRPVNTKILFQLVGEASNAVPVTSLSYYPLDLRWDRVGGILHAGDTSRIRAAVDLECQFGTIFTVIFGFDLVWQAGEPGSQAREYLAPGIWARVGRIHNSSVIEGFGYWPACGHPECSVKSGRCEFVLPSASVGDPAKEGMLNCRIDQREIMGGYVFIVQVKIT